MAKHSKTLQLIASKLGLGDDDKVLSKAAEFERLLQMKSTASSNLSDTGKVVICLDLAANMFGAEFDLKAAVKYSGLKPSIYTNSRKVVENLLELNCDRLTTALLCAAMQCSGVQELADRILEEYQGKAKMEVDLNLPQYVCMAVFQACRLNKVKISKSKITEKSRLKPAQWSKLDAEWTKFVDENFAAAAKKKRGRPPKNSVAVEDEEKMDIDNIQKEDQQEPQIEPYEDWKNRILEAAYKQLKAVNKDKETNQNHSTETNQNYSENSFKEDFLTNKLNTTPRRSPRKTPQKFEPYKSPNKNKGVRLLFPL